MSDSELKGVWLDGPYLVARHRLAQFPDQCIVCGDPSGCQPLLCKVRKRPWMLQLIVWWTGVFSNAVVIRPYVCDHHRRQELGSRWIGRVMLLIASALMLVPTILAFSKTKFVNERASVLLVCLGFCLLWAWVYYRIFRTRLIYAEQIKKRDAWIQGVHPSVLDHIPPL